MPPHKESHNFARTQKGQRKASRHSAASAPGTPDGRGEAPTLVRERAGSPNPSRTATPSIKPPPKTASTWFLEKIGALITFLPFVFWVAIHARLEDPTEDSHQKRKDVYFGLMLFLLTLGASFGLTNQYGRTFFMGEEDENEASAIFSPSASQTGASSRTIYSRLSSRHLTLGQRWFKTSAWVVRFMRYFTPRQLELYITNVFFLGGLENEHRLPAMMGGFLFNFGAAAAQAARPRVDREGNLVFNAFDLGAQGVASMATVAFASIPAGFVDPQKSATNDLTAKSVLVGILALFGVLNIVANSDKSKTGNFRCFLRNYFLPFFDAAGLTSVVPIIINFLYPPALSNDDTVETVKVSYLAWLAIDSLLTIVARKCCPPAAVEQISAEQDSRSPAQLEAGGGAGTGAGAGAETGDRTKGRPGTGGSLLVPGRGTHRADRDASSSSYHSLGRDDGAAPLAGSLRDSDNSGAGLGDDGEAGADADRPSNCSSPR